MSLQIFRNSANVVLQCEVCGLPVNQKFLGHSWVDETYSNLSNDLPSPSCICHVSCLKTSVPQLLANASFQCPLCAKRVTINPVVSEFLQREPVRAINQPGPSSGVLFEVFSDSSSEETEDARKNALGDAVIAGDWEAVQLLCVFHDGSISEEDQSWIVFNAVHHNQLQIIFSTLSFSNCRLECFQWAIELASAVNPAMVPELERMFSHIQQFSNVALKH